METGKSSILASYHHTVTAGQWVPPRRLELNSQVVYWQQVGEAGGAGGDQARSMEENQIVITVT